MDPAWRAIALVLCLAASGCLQAANPAPSNTTTSPPPHSGGNQSPASPSSPSNHTPNTTNHTNPPTHQPLNLTIQPQASYATLHANPNHTITNITLTNPQNQTQTLTPNKPAPITLGHLTPNTTYSVQINTAQTENKTLTFTTTPSPRIYPSPGNGTTIQPGDFVRSPSSGCTLNVVLRGPTNHTLYMLTAGHCTRRGDHVRVHGEDIGTVVATNGSDNGDWALIKINPNTRDQVHPGIQYWTGPTWITGKQDVNHSDTICWYGQGLYISDLSPHRCGDLDSFHREGAIQDGRFRYRGVVSDGDSGAPVLHYSTGSIIGILTSDTAGTTICFALQEIHNQGYDVSLLAHTYAPPPEDPFLPYDGPFLFNYSIEPGDPCPSVVWAP